MENEIELKIMLAAPCVEPVKRWVGRLSVIEQGVDLLGNTYFDTPAQFFAAQQMGLRVRTKNNEYEMTLKTKGEIQGGLHIRPEYNLALSDSQPDFKRLVSAFNLQIAQADEIAAQLEPVFSTDFTRHKWLVGVNQSQIEIGLDQGVVKNAFGEEPICELEFELKAGKLPDVLALLAQLPAQDGMWFSGLSKAQRGYLVGQAVKFERQITQAVQTLQGYALEQQLADYIRCAPENQTVLNAFNALSDRSFTHWQAAQVYLKSAEYLALNLQKLTQMYG